MKPDRDPFREQLNAELQQLAGTIVQAGLSAGTVELDQSSVGRVSRMDALMQQAMAKGMQERLVTRVRKLQAALARMEAGTYGRCCECQADVEPERLAADPAAVFCMTCAQARDSH